LLSSAHLLSQSTEVSTHVQPISFSDFFLADVLTSMAKVCDITFIIVFSQCYFLSSLLVISNLLKHMSKTP
jgi:hypothetical protein